MLIPKVTNVAKGISSDVFGQAMNNATQGEPVTAEGLRAAAKDSAMNRLSEVVEPIQFGPLAKAIRNNYNNSNINPNNASKTERSNTKTNSKTKQTSKQNGRSKGNGSGNGKGNGKYSGGNQQSPTTQPNTSAFGNIDTGSLRTIQSEKDTTYWTDVLQNQRTNDGVKNTSRTAITLISNNHDDVLQPGNSLKLKTAYSAIYMQKLNEAIGTTGGNASIKNSFTEDNFWRHQRYAYSAILKLAEVYSLRAWNPPYSETNTVIRQLKNYLCSNVTLMDATNRLEEAIAQYALPPEAINYGISLFQTFKKSPISGGVHHRLMSDELIRDFTDGNENFANTVAGMNQLSDEMTNTTWTQNNGTITSLLLSKCNGFVSCRCTKVGAQYPTYQMDMNAIVDNMKYAWEFNSTDYVSTEPTTDDALLVAFPFDVGEVPKHVSSSLLLRYEQFGSSLTGYPWFKQIDGNQASRFILCNDENYSFKVHFLPIANEFRDITDNNFSIYSSGDTAYFKPIGLNTQLFQPTYPVVVNATRDTLYNAYSMPSMS
jgi:hypothetical protein